MVNIILSPSQQPDNKCLEGDSEQDHCFVIAQRCADYLKSYNANVCLIPKITNMTNDKDRLYEVVRISNEFAMANGGKSFHLDIHTDGGYDGLGASGFYISEAGKSFILQIYKEISRITPWGDSPVRERELFVLRHTTAIAGLIEISFHDKKEQAQWIHGNIDNIARAIVKGFESATGIVRIAEDKHWAEDAYRKLVDDGRVIIDKRYDQPLTRGEYFVLEAQKLK